MNELKVPSQKSFRMTFATAPAFLDSPLLAELLDGLRRLLPFDVLFRFFADPAFIRRLRCQLITRIGADSDASSRIVKRSVHHEHAEQDRIPRFECRGRPLS